MNDERDMECLCYCLYGNMMRDKMIQNLRMTLEVAKHRIVWKKTRLSWGFFIDIKTNLLLFTDRRSSKVFLLCKNNQCQCFGKKLSNCQKKKQSRAFVDDNTYSLM